MFTKEQLTDTEVLESVFQSGVQPFCHSTGCHLFRIITGVSGKLASEIDPFWVPGNANRNGAVGNQNWYGSTSLSGAFLEALRFLPPDKLALSGAFLISAYTTGEFLNHETLTGTEHYSRYMDSESHAYSQNCNSYLEKYGLYSGLNGSMWGSVAASEFGFSATTVCLTGACSETMLNVLVSPLW